MSAHDGIRPLPWRYDDGGRAAAGFQGKAGDCVARAIAIATGKPYREVYATLAAGNATQRAGKRGKRSRSARDGVDTRRAWFGRLMASLGFQWIPTMAIGSGCTTHMAVGEVPDNCIANVSKHIVAVVDGVVRDTHDPTRGGTRCVYGWWEQTKTQP